MKTSLLLRLDQRKLPCLKRGLLAFMQKVFAIAAAGMILTACHDSRASAPQVRFVIPNDFKGMITITEATDGEADEATNGVITIRVPQSGNVILRSTKVFTGWHTEKAVYENNVGLPMGQFQQAGSKKIAFFSLWSDGNGHRYWLVGTRADFEKLQK